MGVDIVFETHSLTEDNERGISTGWLDGRLSTNGRRLAAELGRRRLNDPLTAVYTSDLGRAVETATIAFGDGHLPILKDWRLRECNYGALNGAPAEHLERERSLRLDVPFPSGESWREAVERHGWFLNDMLRRHDGDRILVIGHIATRWALDHFIDGHRLEDLVEQSLNWQEGWTHHLSPSSLTRVANSS